MRVPSSTYRLQFNSSFRFRDAQALVPYLHSFGISHVYASPIFVARSRSSHGYDVVDPTRINPDLGSRQEFDDLVEALRKNDMGLVIDIVPNHMAASVENPWWLDVLRYGRDSRFANVFDIDWERGGGKVALPVLRESFEDALERRFFTLRTTDGELWLHYHDHRLPVESMTQDAIQADSGDGDLVRRVLMNQPYKLVHWRDGARELNYRRFFNINDLVGVRVEDPEVFAASHTLIISLIEDGSVNGLRVDHIDGLLDPKSYLDRLASITGPGGSRPYVVVEKILTGAEELPSAWNVSGTTGYDFLNDVNGLFIDPAGLQSLRAHAQAGGVYSLADIASREKRRMTGYLFDAETAALTDDLNHLAISAGSDMDGDALREALVEVSVQLRVYRTYVDGNGVSDRDKRYIDEALNLAERERPNLALNLEFLRSILLVDAGVAGMIGRDRLIQFVMRWQQYSGPLTAKGIEDTALYQYNALISANEVGLDPHGPGSITISTFHSRNQSRQQHWPATMNATATHDTKRGEDTRARINVLSELAADWLERLGGWTQGSGAFHAKGAITPTNADKVMIYQTLLGAWPDEDKPGADFVERLAGFAVKAAREAKVSTSWKAPDQSYEGALVNFIRQLFEGPDSTEFLSEIREARQRTQYFGSLNSLAQTVLKLTCPGVPDIYQGTELWDLSLVDPDNRRPVDYVVRQYFLARTHGLTTEKPDVSMAEMTKQLSDGRLKQLLMQRILNWRKEHAALFLEGEYVPLVTTTEHLVAFVRKMRSTWALVVVPRLVAGMTTPGGMPVGATVWLDHEIRLPTPAPEEWTNVLTGKQVSLPANEQNLRVAAVLADLPVAVLQSGA